MMQAEETKTQIQWEACGLLRAGLTLLIFRSSSEIQKHTLIFSGTYSERSNCQHSNLGNNRNVNQTEILNKVKSMGWPETVTNEDIANDVG